MPLYFSNARVWYFPLLSMTRRDFLGTAASTVAPRLQATEANASYQKMGLNTYCLRAFKWTDKQLLDYAESLKLDGVFLQDSLDPDREKLEHWREIGAHARQLKLHIETGVGAVLPRSSGNVEASRQQLLLGLARSHACGSPLVRCLLAGDRAHLPPGFRCAEYFSDGEAAEIRGVAVSRRRHQGRDRES